MTLGPRVPPPETARHWQDTPRPVLSGRRAWTVPSRVWPRSAPTRALGKALRPHPPFPPALSA